MINRLCAPFCLGSNFSLAADSMQTLALTIYIYEDTRGFETTLYTVARALSSITSRHLQKIDLHLIFSFDDFSMHEPEVSPEFTNFLLTNPPESILSGADPVYDVALTINWDDDDTAPILDAAIDIVPRFFAPWGTRGMLEVFIPRMYRMIAEQAVRM